jgi:hypothetical protein
MAVEQAAYRVIEKQGDVELREYAPVVVAETVVEGGFGAAGNEAFQRLFLFIGGENQQAASIAMTAPVEATRNGEKIAMTAPVEARREGERWRVGFVLPHRYTLETAPQPKDARVQLREVPVRRVAALRFSGGWGEEKFVRRERQLVSLLPPLGLEPAGPPIWARYNPPFWPKFLRRNEILVEVRPVAGK